MQIILMKTQNMQNCRIFMLSMLTFALYAPVPRFLRGSAMQSVFDSSFLNNFDAKASLATVCPVRPIPVRTFCSWSRSNLFNQWLGVCRLCTPARTLPVMCSRYRLGGCRLFLLRDQQMAGSRISQRVSAPQFEADRQCG